jgi:Asp-tRNA(Asn)/Glu-tRNA(Gln) amidotransferase A subunit family amidase
MHTDSALYGLTRNPWNPARTAVGSSGGEAVALATGMSPIGLGNDIGGSLRNPANACGVASIRPTQGRVPHAGFIPVEENLLAVQLMHTNGPMARRVTDVRLGLSVLSGAHPRDPWSLDPPPDAPAHLDPHHDQSRLRRMAERVRRPEDDHRAARSPPLYSTPVGSNAQIPVIPRRRGEWVKAANPLAASRNAAASSRAFRPSGKITFRNGQTCGISR